jgi:hypothetical protein
MALGACDFILKDVNILENERGVCFSYTPIDNHTIHNANLMGAALLSRAFAVTGNREHLEWSKRAVDFTLSYQEEDGSWAYSFNRFAGKKRMQIDFHQGFNLDALMDFIHYSNLTDPNYTNALLKGARFYQENQFDAQGRSMWRLPWRWPVDIHHQAQGIITFARLSTYDKKYLDWSKRIALWAIQNMRDPTGYFYYQKVGKVDNKISYMRWGQAWMMYALSELIVDWNAANGL